MYDLDDQQDIIPKCSLVRQAQPKSAASDPLWTVEDLACYLKLQPETIRSMARRGELPALKIGKVWRFQQQDIHKMIVSLE